MLIGRLGAHRSTLDSSPHALWPSSSKTLRHTDHDLQKACGATIIDSSYPMRHPVWPVVEDNERLLVIVRRGGEGVDGRVRRLETEGTGGHGLRDRRSAHAGWEWTTRIGLQWRSTYQKSTNALTPHFPKAFSTKMLDIMPNYTLSNMRGDYHLILHSDISAVKISTRGS